MRTRNNITIRKNYTSITEREIKRNKVLIDFNVFYNVKL